MRTVLTNLGSLGDILPLVALGSELKTNGHEVLLAFPPTYASYLTEQGLELTIVGPNLNYPELQRKETKDTLSGVDPYHTFCGSLRILATMLPGMLKDLQAACQGADLLISGHLQPASRMIHELTGIPFVSVHTNHFGGKQPESYRQAACEVINPFRQQHGLPPLDDPIYTDVASPQLALHAVSRHMRPPSPNWPAHHHVTGFFFLRSDHWQPSTRLSRFLAEGEPPVVVTFSSLAHPDPLAVTEILSQSVRRVGCRAVVQAGWSGLGTANTLPANILEVGFVPHSWLFPLAACVVHAGGAGTTAATLHAGAPAVILPTIGDQPIWADLVRSMGCAGAVIPFKELTTERLASALMFTLKDALIRRRASEVAHLIRAEEGVRTARVRIEQFMLREGVLIGNVLLAGSSLQYDKTPTGRRKQLQQWLRSRKARAASQNFHTN